MIKLRDDVSPPPAILKKLKEFQDEIDLVTPWSDRSKHAKTLFSRRNTKRNPVFKEIRARISEMCNNTRRCVYCEDSLADEVEHIYPKDIFPDKCFSWENYVYACGPCNGPKNNKFAVFRDDSGAFAEVNPQRGTPASQPPAGKAVFINQREEDPMEYCMLDLAGTFLYRPLPGLTSDKKLKAEYTFDTILRLNHGEREPTRQGRENEYGNFRRRLREYVDGKAAGTPASELKKMIEGIKNNNHITVWKEMQRYHVNGWLKPLDPQLDAWFVAEPDALTW